MNKIHVVFENKIFKENEFRKPSNCWLFVFFLTIVFIALDVIFVDTFLNTIHIVIVEQYFFRKKFYYAFHILQYTQVVSSN